MVRQVVAAAMVPSDLQGYRIAVSAVQLEVHARSKHVREDLEARMDFAKG